MMGHAVGCRHPSTALVSPPTPVHARASSKICFGVPCPSPPAELSFLDRKICYCCIVRRLAACRFLAYLVPRIISDQCGGLGDQRPVRFVIDGAPVANKPQSRLIPLPIRHNHRQSLPRMQGLNKPASPFRNLPERVRSEKATILAFRHTKRFSVQNKQYFIVQCNRQSHVCRYTLTQLLARPGQI